MLTNDPTLMLRIALWALIGAVITPLVYVQKGRSPRWGLIVGLLAGGLGSLILLVPLWVLVGRPRKLCPECTNPIPAELARCPHCDHIFEQLGDGEPVITIGYPELAPLILFSMAGVILALPLIYRRFTLDPAAWLVGGAVLGALIGLFALELLWLAAPRAGKRCPQCGAAVLAAASACPRCAHRFDDTPVDASRSSAESALASWTGQLRSSRLLAWRPIDVRWPWYVAGTVALGLILAQVGLAVPLLSSSRSGSERQLPAIGIPAAPRPDLDLTRSSAQARLSVLGFIFQPYVDESGKSGVFGRNNAEETWIYIMGPEDAVHTIAMTFSRRSDLPEDLRARQAENLDALLTLAVREPDQRAQAREWIAAQDIEQTERADTLIGSLRLSMWYDAEEHLLGVSITAR